jgi:uncharacterized protein
MQVVSLPRGLQRIALADLPRERWRNGAGWTRLIACAGPEDQPDWRVSLAEISQAGPFSHFPGMERTAVLVQGGPLHLKQLSPVPWQWRLEHAGDDACFAGESTLENAPPGADTLVWNVMVRRGRAQVDVQTLNQQPLTFTGAGREWIWVLQGRYTLHTAEGVAIADLNDGEGLSCGDGSRGASLRPASPACRLLATRIR